MRKSIHLATVRTDGRVYHIVPNGNRHARCGIVATNEVYGPTAGTTCAAGTHHVCKNCMRTKAPRDVNATPVDEPTDTWTVTNKVGDEITRFHAETGDAATEYIRRDADCRDWSRLEGGVSRRRLRTSEL